VVFGEGTEANKTWDDFKAFTSPIHSRQAAQLAGCRPRTSSPPRGGSARRARQRDVLWCMGLNQRTRGVWANNMVHNLHLITGKIGTPGSTSFSLTGQPNACGGVRDGGALSHLLPYGRLVANDKHRAEMEALWKVPAGTLNPKPGLPTIDMFRGVEDGKIKVLYVMCTNPGQSLPNVEPLPTGDGEGDDFLVVADAYHPTRTSEFADVVLPAALWAEKEGVYGCAERRYQLLEKAVRAHRAGPSGLRDPRATSAGGSATEIWCNFNSPTDIWNEILPLTRAPCTTSAA
jgi:nitrate reductase (cytochrome)